MLYIQKNYVAILFNTHLYRQYSCYEQILLHACSLESAEHENTHNSLLLSSQCKTHTKLYRDCVFSGIFDSIMKNHRYKSHILKMPVHFNGLSHHSTHCSTLVINADVMKSSSRRDIFQLEANLWVFYTRQFNYFKDTGGFYFTSLCPLSGQLNQRMNEGRIQGKDRGKGQISGQSVRGSAKEMSESRCGKTRRYQGYWMGISMMRFQRRCKNDGYEGGGLLVQLGLRWVLLCSPAPHL